MKEFCFGLFLLIVPAAGLLAQDNATVYNKDTKFSFERDKSFKTTLVSQGDYFTVYKNSGDTAISYYGRLYHADKLSIYFGEVTLQKSVENYPTYSERIEFPTDSVLQLYNSEIDYFERDNNRVTLPASIASMAFSTIILAPLFCINKNYAYRFHTKKYVEILKYSGLVLVSSSIVAGLLSKNEKYILKPKFIPRF